MALAVALTETLQALQVAEWMIQFAGTMAVLTDG